MSRCKSNMAVALFVCACTVACGDTSSSGRRGAHSGVGQDAGGGVAGDADVGVAGDADVGVAGDAAHDRPDASAAADPVENLPTALRLVTELDSPIRFPGAAGLLRQISDSPTDPLDYVLARTLLLVDGDAEGVINAYSGEVLEGYDEVMESHFEQSSLLLWRLLPNIRSSAARHHFRKIAGVLQDLRLAQIHTDLALKPSATDGVRAAQHRLIHFSAQLGGRVAHYPYDPDKRLSEQRPVAQPSSATSLRTLQQTGVEIDGHTMELPVADALLGTLLFDAFGKSNVQQILFWTVRCDIVAAMFATKASALPDIDPDAIKEEIGSACAVAIEDIAEKIIEVTEDDVADAGHLAAVAFEGSARVDGKGLADGVWSGLGHFSGSPGSERAPQ